MQRRAQRGKRKQRLRPMRADSCALTTRLARLGKKAAPGWPFTAPPSVHRRGGPVSATRSDGFSMLSWSFLPSTWALVVTDAVVREDGD